MRTQRPTTLTTIEESPSPQPVYPRTPFPPYDPVRHRTPSTPSSESDQETSATHPEGYHSVPTGPESFALSDSDNGSEISDDTEVSLDLDDCSTGHQVPALAQTPEAEDEVALALQSFLSQTAKESGAVQEFFGVKRARSAEPDGES